jgi:HK97 family phage major capsid protein
MSIEEIKGVAENLGKAFEEFKGAQAENLKKTDALLEEKMAKISDDMAAKIEEVQKKQAQLEAASQRPSVADVKETETKTQELFNDFLKKGSFQSHDRGFEGFLADKGVDTKALSVIVGSEGGYLVPTAFGGVINARVFESSPVRQYANVMTIAGDAVEFPLDNDEASAGWAAEKASRPTTNSPTFDLRRINTHEMYAKPEATQKLLDDAAINAEQWLVGKISEKFARLEATAFVSGNGATQPMGILTNTTTSTSYDARNVQVVNSGSSGAFTYNGLVDLQVSLKEAYQSNAVFMSKRAAFGSLMKIVDLDGRPIFNLMFDKNTGLASSIMGRPLVFADDVPTVAADAKALIYGDFRAGYTIVDKVGVRILRDPYSNKPFVQFYATKRVGGDVMVAEALKVQALTA